MSSTTRKHKLLDQELSIDNERSLELDLKNLFTFDHLIKEIRIIHRSLNTWIRSNQCQVIDEIDQQYKYVANLQFPTLSPLFSKQDQPPQERRQRHHVMDESSGKRGP